MTKRRKRKPRKMIAVNLSGEQFGALQQFQKDLQTARPRIKETAQAAQRIWQDTVNAPTLRISEGARPEDMPEPLPEQWHIGHAQVNYVDKIKRRGEHT